MMRVNPPSQSFFQVLDGIHDVTLGSINNYNKEQLELRFLRILALLIWFPVVLATKQLSLSTT